MTWGKGRNGCGRHKRKRAPCMGKEIPKTGARASRKVVWGLAWVWLMGACLGNPMVCEAAGGYGLKGPGDLAGLSGLRRIGDLQGLDGLGQTGDFDGLDGLEGLDDLEDADSLEELEGLDELEELEELEEEMSDEELNQALEEYFQGIDGRTAEQDAVTPERVTDPAVRVETVRSGDFKYTLPNGNYFISSVPSGMITSGPVDFYAPEGVVGLVERDDVKVAFPDSWHFTEKGVYHMMFLVLQPPGDAAIDYIIYEVNFYFTIIGGMENSLGAVPAPEGFVINGARMDGKNQKVEQERCYFISGDGYYEIGFEAQGDLKASARTEFTRDTMAPFLSFSREIEPEGITGEVEFYPSEPGCRVYMHYNGNRGYAATNRLTAAGVYELSVEDKAGNSRIYHVRLRQTYSLVDWRVFGAAAVLAVFGLVRLLMVRRDMRVL